MSKQTHWVRFASAAGAVALAWLGSATTSATETGDSRAQLLAVEEHPPANGPSVGPDEDLEMSLGAEIGAFVRRDAASPPAPCQILFVGSSSIVRWENLAKDMAPLPVMNRGFGGSHIEYVNRWFDQIVAPYRPRAIVFYAGENDIAAGKPVERVVDDFEQFMERKVASLGQTPVYFISIKPSKLRWSQFDSQAEVNAAIRALAAQRSDLHYVDVVSRMLANGRPRELYEADGLHMTPTGYAIWSRAIRPILLRDARAEAHTCHRHGSALPPGKAVPSRRRSFR